MSARTPKKSASSPRSANSHQLINRFINIDPPISYQCSVTSGSRRTGCLNRMLHTTHAETKDDEHGSHGNRVKPKDLHKTPSVCARKNEQQNAEKDREHAVNEHHL